MNPFLQQVVVTVVVLIATFVVGRRYLPLRMRRRGRALLAAALGAVGLHKMADRLANELPEAASCSTGCGTCGGCGGAAGVADGPATTPAVDAPPGSGLAAGGGIRFSMSADELKRTLRR